MIALADSLFSEITGRHRAYTEDNHEADPQHVFKGPFVEIVAKVLAAVGINLANQSVGDMMKEFRSRSHNTGKVRKTK